MKLVWPITALWTGPIALFVFFFPLTLLREKVFATWTLLAGFLTSYPANWWLLKKGIKERM